ERLAIGAPGAARQEKQPGAARQEEHKDVQHRAVVERRKVVEEYLETGPAEVAVRRAGQVLLPVFHALVEAARLPLLVTLKDRHQEVGRPVAFVCPIDGDPFLPVLLWRYQEQRLPLDHLIIQLHMIDEFQDLAVEKIAVAALNSLGAAGLPHQLAE